MLVENKYIYNYNLRVYIKYSIIKYGGAISCLFGYSIYEFL